MTEKAIFAAGCFWGIEAAFRRIDGVSTTSVGYTGGTTDDPDYRAVCGGQTGHAEAVMVEFDPDRVTYDELLDVFWGIHDPTTLDRQGPDVGSQYRSAIFTLGEVQDTAARASKARFAASSGLGDRIVTEIEPAGPYHLAEDDHQQYLEKRQGGARRFGF